jgi:molecular chaperone DnaK
MSIVAVGAALFASTQKLPPALRAAGASQGAALLALEYEAMTTDPAPLLAGRVAPEGAARIASVRVTREGGGYDSGPVKLKGGVFGVDLAVREGAQNLFRVEGADADGRPVSCTASASRSRRSRSRSASCSPTTPSPGTCARTRCSRRATP